jgi:hypothetical protein
MLILCMPHCNLLYPAMVTLGSNTVFCKLAAPLAMGANPGCKNCCWLMAAQPRVAILQAAAVLQA